MNGKETAKMANSSNAKSGFAPPPDDNARAFYKTNQADKNMKAASAELLKDALKGPINIGNGMNIGTGVANTSEHIVYRLVLTGGPCSGKTTGQARLSTFFENLGWKVYRVPETATTLFSGGIRFPDLSDEQKDEFQENLIKVMISIERTFFALAARSKQNCIVICDRGIMDATAYMPRDAWDKVQRENGWNSVELRDNRYNQVIHLVTSADGAEEYYNMENNPTRTEDVELARELDKRTVEAWVGHPYIDVIDNSTDFDTKMRRMILAICRRMDIEPGDRLEHESRKAKFLLKSLPRNELFPPFQDFNVVHDYLITTQPKTQSRLRKRGQNGNWSYQHTLRRAPEGGGKPVELRRQITHRDYVTMLSQRDVNHNTVFKIRRCFLWQNTYFQMDIYKAPVNELCFGLILLDTYTTLSGEALKAKLPSFLEITREVTNDPMYSMYNLSMKLRRQSAPMGLGVMLNNSVNGIDIKKIVGKQIAEENEKEVNNNETIGKMTNGKAVNGVAKENN